MVAVGVVKLVGAEVALVELEVTDPEVKPDAPIVEEDVRIELEADVGDGVMLYTDALT